MFISDTQSAEYYKLNDLSQEQVEIILKEALRESGKEYYWRNLNKEHDEP